MSANQQVSLIKYGKAEIALTDNMQSLRFLTRQGNDQAQMSAGCGSVTDPVLLEVMQHSCKEAALSHIDKEQILDAIVPPREWEEDGKKYKQLISKEPSSREDVIALNELLNEQLTLRQARPDGICPIRRELANQCFDELIRQITINQAERGLLLLRVRDELRMTLTAYQDLFVSGRDYDPRKTVAKGIMGIVRDLTVKYNEYVVNHAHLEEERNDLARAFQNNEVLFREERESANKKHHEEFQFLKRVNNTLKQQIDAMNDPSDDTDPVIESHGTEAENEGKGIYNYTVCDE